MRDRFAEGLGVLLFETLKGVQHGVQSITADFLPAVFECLGVCSRDDMSADEQTEELEFRLV